MCVIFSYSVFYCCLFIFFETASCYLHLKIQGFSVNLEAELTTLSSEDLLVSDPQQHWGHSHTHSHSWFFFVGLFSHGLGIWIHTLTQQCSYTICSLPRPWFSLRLWKVSSPSLSRCQTLHIYHFPGRLEHLLTLSWPFVFLDLSTDVPFSVGLYEMALPVSNWKVHVKCRVMVWRPTCF